MTDRWMDRLSEYLDGDLAPGERTALEAHLADCHACRSTLHDLRQVVNRAHALVDRRRAGSGEASRRGSAPRRAGRGPAARRARTGSP
jgi:anti-sigma factor RsiW